MATNAQRAKAKQLKEQQGADPDYVTPVKETDQTKVVEAAIKSIKKDTGTAFIRLGSKSQEMRPVLPTGIFGIDHDVFGSGGAPRGRIVEIFGAPSGGKGTFTAQLLANTQRLDNKKENAYIDAEHALDPVYAGRLGVDVDNLLLAQPDCGEDALQATLDIISTGAIKLCVVDSVAALVPRAELEGAMSDAHMGLTARMMGQALRKLTAIVSKTGTTLVFINQTRSNLGVTFGNPTTTPGGKALTFFSSVRIQIDRLAQYKEKEQNIGNITKFKAVKNKTAPPFRETTLNLLFDLPGFDGDMSLAAYAIEHGIWKQDGAMYTLASTGEVVKGKLAVRDAMRDDKVVRKITEEATLVAMGKSEQYIKRALRG